MLAVGWAITTPWSPPEALGSRMLVPISHVRVFGPPEAGSSQGRTSTVMMPFPMRAVALPSRDSIESIRTPPVPPDQNMRIPEAVLPVWPDRGKMLPVWPDIDAMLPVWPDIDAMLPVEKLPVPMRMVWSVLRLRGQNSRPWKSESEFALMNRLSASAVALV